MKKRLTGVGTFLLNWPKEILAKDRPNDLDIKGEKGRT